MMNTGYDMTHPLIDCSLLNWQNHSKCKEGLIESYVHPNNKYILISLQKQIIIPAANFKPCKKLQSPKILGPKLIYQIATCAFLIGTTFPFQNILVW